MAHNIGIKEICTYYIMNVDTLLNLYHSIINLESLSKECIYPRASLHVESELNDLKL